MDAIKIGQFIAKKRKERGLTQVSLAKKVHVTDKAISKWERGLSFPDISHINALSEALEIPVGELMEFFDDKCEADDTQSSDGGSLELKAERSDNKEGLMVPGKTEDEMAERKRYRRKVNLRRCFITVAACLIVLGLGLNLTGLYEEMKAEFYSTAAFTTIKDGPATVYSVNYGPIDNGYNELGLACIALGVLICIVLIIKRWTYGKKDKCNIASDSNDNK